MLFGRRQVGPIGIDFGEATVRMVQVTHGADGPEVIAVREHHLAGGTSEPAPLSWSRPGLASTLREMLAAGGFSGRRVVVALGAADAQVKNMRLPPMPPEELAAAVQFEAAERFPFGPEPATYQFIPTGLVGQGSEVQQELAVVGVADSVVRACLHVLSEAGLIVQAIDYVPCAVFRSFERFLRRHDDANEVNAFLDLGYSGSRVVISQGQSIVFVKMLDVGGSTFDRVVSDGLSIPMTEARQLRRRAAEGVSPLFQQTAAEKADRPLDATTRKRLAELLDVPYQQLSKEISLCLRYCMVTYRGHQCQSVTCVGGESYTDDILDRITVVSGVPARRGHPLRNIACDRVFDAAQQSAGLCEWATALGLALRLDDQSMENVA